MKNFILCSLLLLVGWIATAAASPPGLNSNPNCIVQVLPDKADLQVAIAESYNYMLVPSADARDGCMIGVVHYTISNDQSLQAELQPIFLFKHTELTQGLYSDLTKTPAEKLNCNYTSTLTEPVCAHARDAVFSKISGSNYQLLQLQTNVQMRT